MNKIELVNAVAEKSGLSKADAKKAVDGVLDAISGALKSGDKVAWSHSVHSLFQREESVQVLILLLNSLLQLRLRRLSSLREELNSTVR